MTDWLVHPPRWLGNGWLTLRHVEAMLDGLLYTSLLSLAVIATGTLLGCALGIARHQARARWLAWPLAALHNGVRNVPLLVQVLFWYFGIGALLPESWMLWLNTPRVLLQLGDWALPWPSFELLAAWWALSLYATAFIAGDIRSGLNAVPPGQWEAARASGMRQWQVLRYVVLPQAWRTAWPPVLGSYLNTLKNTSLTMAIGVMELSYRARQIDAETLLTFQSFALASVLYVLLIVLVQRLLRPRQRAAWGAA
ncbi:polar amino acid transport system permease protein [Andreprevotia lacus DSM 23236]|jgi:polar amino acid transport system permease protein|uniref:Polar amino acid transport system permease protein n=1 Tax=Andreprevotia lacus DSM 23236 TaxID=1121001 RepID=A0A1W1XPD0_9NEIS|nr:amino acid ABC transporter permease [Andreprevotia lacus]SMC25737.1 polar amino acid transport system permease protein [Andreprevotia lacus DSM 23236]